ncbi:hypothetical protein [Chryseobacterium indoltheticum]
MGVGGIYTKYRKQKVKKATKGYIHRKNKTNKEKNKNTHTHITKTIRK